MARHRAVTCAVCGGPMTARGLCTRRHEETPTGALVVRLLRVLKARAITQA